MKTAFKEKGPNEQFYRDEQGNWIKCGESLIQSLWVVWVISRNAHHYTDEEGFIVFDFTDQSSQPLPSDPE